MINKYLHKIIFIAIIFTVLLMSIGYSVLESNLKISGEVNYRPQKDVRITNFTSNNISENVNLQYFNFSKHEIKLGYTTTSSASITFNVEVSNFSNLNMGILKVDGLDNNVEVQNNIIGKKLVGPAGTNTFNITFNSTTAETKAYLLKLDFEEVYTITYKNIIGTYQNEILKGDNLNIDFSSNAPSDVLVDMNNSSISDFTYENGHLLINNVTGNIIITGIETPSFTDESGASNPVLSDNMIPVVYDETRKEWVKQDLDKSYDYSKQVWANAVTVVEDGIQTRSYYQKAKAGTVISMDDINTMWVWIPRYSYTIKSEDGINYFGKKETGRTDMPSRALPGEIDVKFITVSENDSEGSAKYTKEEASGWFTPPGFTFGDKDLSGIWLGKFETSSLESCIGTSVANTGCDLESLTVQIKPNVTSWRSIRVSTLELVSMGLTKNENIYGFDNTYDSHTAKDSEWALITYLTQSKYGKYGNSLYTGENKQVYMNNHSGYVTGCSAGQGTADNIRQCVNQYDDMVNNGEGKGYLGAGASTTGNIYGIYDVNGGAWEYTMGVLEERTGETQELNSGYKGQIGDGSFIEGRDWPIKKYYNVYTTNSSITACNGSTCKGYALNEVANWYDDRATVVDTTSPWFVRGGTDYGSTNAGVFAYGRRQGYIHSSFTFRIVLIPNN